MPQFQPGQSGNPNGRPRKAERYAAPIREAEDRIADKLPVLLDDLFKLAHGGWWEEEEELKAAGLLTTGSGEFETPIFPDKSPGELVVVGRRRKRAAPDLKALTYLVDRILGKTTTHIEADVAGDGSLTIRVVYDDDTAGGAAPEKP